MGRGWHKVSCGSTVCKGFRQSPRVTLAPSWGGVVYTKTGHSPQATLAASWGGNVCVCVWCACVCGVCVWCACVCGVCLCVCVCVCVRVCVWSVSVCGVCGVCVCVCVCVCVKRLGRVHKWPTRPPGATLTFLKWYLNSATVFFFHFVIEICFILWFSSCVNDV